LHKDLYENSTGRGRIFLSDFDCSHAAPIDTVCVEKMGIELCSVSQFVDLKPMDCFILLDENQIEVLLVVFSHLAESLG